MRDCHRVERGEVNGGTLESSTALDLAPVLNEGRGNVKWRMRRIYTGIHSN